MTSQSAFVLRGRNPDILTCIANLSNDEVFTPPELANQMLDTLAQAWAANNDGANIWADKTVTFLDPCTKSGVFLREITSRLSEGLKDAIPDLQKRVDHILTKQVFGIGITQITSLLARRSVYCSKLANGEHSIAKSFANEAGNIWFERTKHTWEGNKCKYCSAPKVVLDRSGGVENYAYPFIHTDDIKTWITEKFGEDMQFDVVIGNPPYQMGDSGHGASARPIYQYFVEQARALAPEFMCFVTPARWFAGGKGLDEFRNSMLVDNHLRVIHDFLDSSEVFPGPDIKGGVCYFLWNRDNPGDAMVITHDREKITSARRRVLLEPGLDIFIRFNTGLAILKKVVAIEGSATEGSLALSPNKAFSSIVSSRKPFGFATDFRGATKSTAKANVPIHQIGGLGYVAKSSIVSGHELVSGWKVFVGYAGSGDQYPSLVLARPFVGQMGSICTETYLCIGPFKTKSEAVNALQYLTTRFARFMILLRKISQHVTKSVYGFLPSQDFGQSWTDAKLYRKYKLTKEEIEYIESMVRPMKADDE